MASSPAVFEVILCSGARGFYCWPCMAVRFPAMSASGFSTNLRCQVLPAPVNVWWWWREENAYSLESQQWDEGFSYLEQNVGVTWTEEWWRERKRLVKSAIDIIKPLTVIHQSHRREQAICFCWFGRIDICLKDGITTVLKSSPSPKLLTWESNARSKVVSTYYDARSIAAIENHQSFNFLSHGSNR